MNTTLKPQAFKPSAPVRSYEGFRNTVIEDSPQVSLRKAGPMKLQSRTALISPMSDDFPTPKANIVHQHLIRNIESSPSSSNSDSDSDLSSLWSKGSAKSFDELYDVSESDSEEIPIKLSTSVKKRVGRRSSKNRYPSLVIPSPGQWPTIDKLRSAVALSPPLKVNLSPSIFTKMHHANLQVPSTSSTPSLDGSLTSEELAASSCPSTPDIALEADSATTWEPPVQLDPSAISLLQHITGEEHADFRETAIEIPLEAMEEMREIVESPPLTGKFKITTSGLAPPNPNEADDELSALSVPSPGGFFASLDSTVARKTWSNVEPAPTTSIATEFYGVPFRPTSSSLPTSTATSFYNLPWDTRPSDAVEHVVAIASPCEVDPITARKVVFSPTDVIKEVDEIDEAYDQVLQQHATANIDRTQLWLCGQTAYMQAVCESPSEISGFENIEDAVPKTPDQPLGPSKDTSPGKKSVRFADSPAAKSDEIVSENPKRISPIHDGTFWEAWRHTKRSQRARDVFQHRQARAEADQVQRISLHKQYADQLSGKFEINCAERPAPQRPVSSFLPTAPDDEKKELIEQAERERQALEQLRSSAWSVAAQKEINGGKLLTSPIVQTFKDRKNVKILDLAGQVHCSWAWAVAHSHPKAAVYTSVSSDAEAHVASLDGPSNHFVATCPRPWELPFENEYFDVVSARNLYAHLRTLGPCGSDADEWDLTLQECLRVLKPGGYLEFDLLDAELVHADDAGQALGVEFAFNLRTRGYEPSAGKTFLPRLKRAGFGDIKRAWMVLPVADVNPRWSDAGKRSNGFNTVARTIAADGTVSAFQPPLTGSTNDVRAVTGLLGARMWEQWMVKLNSEMGGSDKKVLGDVARVLAECGNDVGWKCLMGWARKGV